MAVKTTTLKEEQVPSEDVGSRNEIDASSETLETLGITLLDRYKKIKGLGERAQFDEDRAKDFEAYHMVPKKKALPFEGAANMASPLPRIAVDSYHANVMSSLFSNGTELKVQPKIIQKEYARKAEKAAHYMNYAVNCEAVIYEALDDADKKSNEFGIGFLEPRYVKEEKWVTEEIEETKQEIINDPQGNVQIKERTVKKKVKRKKTVFDGVKIESIPVESIYYSPFYRCLEEAQKNDVVFKRITLPYRILKERSTSTKESKAIYKRSQVDKVARSIMLKNNTPNTDLEQARSDYDGFYYELAPLEEQIELVESYLWYDVDGDDIKESVKVTFDAGSGVVLRVVITPFRIVELVPRPIDERLPGESIPKICRPLDDEWENFHNSRSNAGQWENSFFGFFRAGGRFNPQQITIKPNHFYGVDDPREVVFPQTQRVSSSYFNEEQLLLNYFERIFALSENMQGVVSRRTTTATENMNLNSRSSIRFMNPFNRIVGQVNKLLNHVWDLSCECAPESKEFYIVGADGVPIFDKMYKDDYSSRFQFELVVQSVFDMQQVRDTTLLAYKMFMANPIVQSHPEMLWNLSQKTLDVLNIDIDLPKPDQAKVHSAFEALDIIRNGGELEPELGIDYDDHIKVFMAALNNEDIKNWDVGAVKNLILYIDKCKILKATLESANLNKSGIFPQGPGQQPGLTVSRNPGQRMNTTRVGETGPSMRQNMMNGGMNVPPMA